MDAAKMAAQSDPTRNYHFSRRWSPPPLERERPPTSAKVQRARIDLENGSTNKNSDPARILQWAYRLDRVADAELAFGHVAAAERLSQHAAELRESLG
jgi:hypothetical protein